MAMFKIVGNERHATHRRGVGAIISRAHLPTAAQSHGWRSSCSAKNVANMMHMWSVNWCDTQDLGGLCRAPIGPRAFCRLASNRAIGGAVVTA